MSISNSDFTRMMFNALIEVTGRRCSSKKAAASVLKTFLEFLKQKYSFLDYISININDESNVDVSSYLDFFESDTINEMIELVIRIIIFDLKDKAGLFFINELKEQLKERYLDEAHNRGIKLDVIQLEQRYLYKRWKVEESLVNNDYKPPDKKADKAVSLFGYAWENVADWSYDKEAMICTLYDKNGDVLDVLSVDDIVNKMSLLLDESISSDSEDTGSEKKQLVENIDITDKEYQFLEMLYEKDLDADVVMHLLDMSKRDLEMMVRKLLKIGVLTYCSHDEVKLTDKGIKYLMSLYGV
ncbi:MAG: hypothetical protein QXS02_03350 [Candidatus Thermoplasmatota archaeon]